MGSLLSKLELTEEQENLISQLDQKTIDLIEEIKIYLGHPISVLRVNEIDILVMLRKAIKTVNNYSSTTRLLDLPNTGTIDLKPYKVLAVLEVRDGAIGAVNYDSLINYRPYLEKTFKFVDGILYLSQGYGSSINIEAQIEVEYKDLTDPYLVRWVGSYATALVAEIESNRRKRYNISNLGLEQDANDLYQSARSDQEKLLDELMEKNPGINFMVR